jgi:hypothetical protein
VTFWQRLTMRRAVPGCCGACRHFDNEAATLEASFAGLVAMGSGFASVRARDGICTLRGVYLPDRAGCGSFVRRQESRE